MGFYTFSSFLNTLYFIPNDLQSFISFIKANDGKIIINKYGL